MNDRTKAFLTELADLLKRYDTEIMVVESCNYNSAAEGVEFESGYTEPFTDDLERVERVGIPLNGGAIDDRDIERKLK